MSDVNLNINVNSDQLDAANQKLDNLGSTADGAKVKVGGMRKEMRATGEATKMMGEALGESGGAMGSIGEAGKLAYAGIELMNGGLKELAVTLLSNPIFIVAAAIAAIVLVLISLNEKNKEAAKQFEESGKALEKYNEGFRDLKDKAAAASDALKVTLGTMTEEQAKLNEAGRTQQSNQLKVEKEYQTALKALKDNFNTEAQNDIINNHSVASATTKMAFDRIKELNTNHAAELKIITQTAADEQVKILIDADQKKAKEDKDANDKAKDEAEKANKARIKKSGEAWMAEIALKEKNEDIATQNQENKSKAEQKIRDDEAKVKADLNKKELSDLELQVKDISEIKAKTVTDVQHLADAELAVQDEKLKQGLINEKQYADKVHTINLNALTETQDLAKKKADGEWKTAEAGTNALMGLSTAFFAVKSKNLKKGSAEDIANAKKAFDINKALSLASATLTGTEAVLAAYKSGVATPIIGPATGAAYAVIAGAVAIANIATIASTEFASPAPLTSSVSSGSTSSISPSTGSSNSSPSVTPDFSVFANDSNGNGNGNNTSNQGSSNTPGVIKAYVVTSEITNNQTAVAYSQNMGKL